MEILIVIGITLAAILTVLLVSVPLILLRGWALSILWGWFVSPIFHFPALTILQAIGIAIVVGAFSTNSNCKQEEHKNTWTPLLTLFGGPVLSVGCGWIIKHWM